VTYNAHELSAYSGQPIELYRFVQGTSIWTQTPFDVEVLYNEENYTRQYLRRGQIQQGQERSAGGLSLQLERGNAVAALYQTAAPRVPVWLTLYRFHYGDAEFRTLLVGRLAHPVWERSMLNLVVLPITAQLARPLLVHKWQPTCNHIVGTGDGVRGCNVDLDDFALTVTATGHSGRMLTAAAFATKPDGYFAGGKVERADGSQTSIRRHAGDSVELMRPLAGFTAPEDLTAFPGCNGLGETCHGTFNNIAEFAGDPWGPSRNPHVSGLN
jgi:uncharacterized phage protein (TIGR02218 family)